jgi:RNA polymerase sigma-70 factor (ECF subfamily)
MELVNFHTDELQQNHEVSEVIENNDNDPEEIYQRRYVLDVFRRALQSISHDFKEVIVLRDLQGLSYEEISDATGMPMGTVKSKINRGRYQLQKKMVRLIEEPNKKRRKVSH